MRMSNEVIRFIPRPRHDEDHTDFPVIAFRSAAPDIATGGPRRCPADIGLRSRASQ
jgi:hypothetical protein